MWNQEVLISNPLVPSVGPEMDCNKTTCGDFRKTKYWAWHPEILIWQNQDSGSQPGAILPARSTWQYLVPFLAVTLEGGEAGGGASPGGSRPEMLLDIPQHTAQ